MKKRLNRIFLYVMIFTVFMIMIPETIVYAKTSAKLSSKDFNYTIDGEKRNFTKYFESLYGKDEEMWYYSFYNRHSDIKTYRGIKIGSTATAVQKKYGKTTKKKYSAKDNIHKDLENRVHSFNNTTCKSYLEYTYKTKDLQQTLRFYLNNKNKVETIMYIRNLSKIDIPSKSVNINVKFEAPKGQKITIKKIDGKEVSVLPKGTKIIIKGKDMDWTTCDIYQINNNGDLLAKCSIFTNNANGKKLYSKMKGHMYKLDPRNGFEIRGAKGWKKISTRTLNSHKYFKLITGSDVVHFGERKPKIYYFKFE